MNIKFYILIILVFSVACSSEKAKSGDQNAEVVIEDGYKTTDENELVIEDKDLKHIQDAVVTAKENSAPNNTVAFDGSKISVMLDGYGNKSETRYFDNHPRVQMILLRTAANGDKQLFVYGQNGVVRDLPPDLANRAMALSADELAQAANITESKREQTISQSFSGVTPQATTVTMQSLPNTQMQAQNQTTEAVAEQNTVREETLARQTESTEKPDSTEQTKTPTRIAENLQNYLPKKRRAVITDNE